MSEKIKQFKEQHPFTALMLVAIAIRLIVIILFPNFGAIHNVDQPSLTQAVLTDLHEWFSRFCSEPTLMLVSRCFYALVSLFIVSFIYRICDLLSNKQTAWILALFPVICCIMPAFGIISNPNVFLAFPLLLYGGMIILRQEVLRKADMNDNVHRTSFFIAGLSLGLAFCLWYPSGLIAISLYLILYLLKNRRGTWFTLLGTLASVAFVVALVFIFATNPLKYFGL